MTIFLSEAMSEGIASSSVPTDPSRVKELLEEMYKLYNIDLLPLRKCILGVHLIAEFTEQTMLQDERELNLISSLLSLFMEDTDRRRDEPYISELFIYG